MNRWIQNAHIRKGALHRQLGYPEHEHIPVPVLKHIQQMPIGGHIHGHTVTRKMKQRATFALNVRRF